MRENSKLKDEFLQRGKVASCPIIDAHAHFGPYQGIYFPQPTAEGTITSMNRAGIWRLIFSSHAALIDMKRGNALTLEVCRKFPRRLYGYLSINPNYPDLIEEALDTFSVTDEFLGFKFWPTYQQYPLTGEHFTPVYEYSNTNRCVILTHTWGNDSYCGPKQVEKIANKYPAIKLLMGHSCSGEWDYAFRLARDYPNLYLDLCGIYQHYGVIDGMTKVAGSTKIIFGTDLPWFDPHYGIGCILSADISDEDRHNILHKNAERIFGWNKKKSPREGLEN